MCKMAEQASAQNRPQRTIALKKNANIAPWVVAVQRSEVKKPCSGNGKRREANSSMNTMS